MEGQVKCDVVREEDIARARPSSQSSLPLRTTLRPEGLEPVNSSRRGRSCCKTGEGADADGMGLCVSKDTTSYGGRWGACEALASRCQQTARRKARSPEVAGRPLWLSVRGDGSLDP